METKICITCGEHQPLSQFGCEGPRGAYRRNTCRQCVKKWNALPKEERDRLKQAQDEAYRTRIEKVCPSCRELKPRDGFFKNKNAKDGMSSECRVCDNIRSKARRKKLKTIEKADIDHQICSRCGQDKLIHHYTHSSQTKTGYSSFCRDCASVKFNEYASSNENRIKMLLQRIRTKCNKENIPYDLTTEDIVIPEKCPVLGIPLVFGGTRGYHSNATEGSPSVDRIDPNGGYVRGNIVIVSWRANRLKGNAMISELRAIADFYEQLDNCRKAAGMVSK